MVQELGTNMLLALQSDEDNDLSVCLQAEASGTENKNGVGSLEEQHTVRAMNMKGKERFYAQQSHFSKRGTSASSGLKQVNTKRQPDKSLLQ